MPPTLEELADAAIAGDAAAVRALCERIQGPIYRLARRTLELARFEPPAPIKQPTLLVWGARDPTHRKTPRDELAPGARVVELAGAAHFPDLEDVPGFVAAVTSFVA
jgi:pimeloyl-ACP methyl ester carboxylesterase